MHLKTGFKGQTSFNGLRSAAKPIVYKLCVCYDLQIVFNIHHLWLANAVQLIAYLSQHGLHGEISFKPIAGQPGKVRIQSDLQATLQYPDQTWSWALHQLPVDYSDVDATRRCANERLGKQLINLDETLGQLTMPGNESVEWDTELALSGNTGNHWN